MSPSVVSFAFDKYFVLIIFELLLSTVQPYFVFVSFPATNSSWSGKWSVISSTYPSTSASLYTLIVYSTTSPIATDIGVFGWLYVAVVAVPSASLLTSGCGILLVISSSFIL